MGELGQRVPKVLLQLGGRSLLEHHFLALRECGVSEVTLCVKHLQNLIRSEVSRLTAVVHTVHCVADDPPMGTAGAIKAVSSGLEDDLLVIYGDVLLHMDLTQLIEFHRRRSPDGTLVVHPNDHPYDSDLVEVDEQQNITAIWPKESRPTHRYYANLGSAAVYVLSPRALECIPEDRPCDFGRDMFPEMLSAGQRLAAYRTTEYLKDIGTPERLAQVQQDWELGIVEGRSAKRPRPAVFLDRDGVINRECGHISRLEDFELLPGVGKAVRRLNRTRYLVIVVSNQSVIARGKLDESGLLEIERKMEWLLGQEGAYVDRAYYCPHHPDKGFPGERREMKVVCDCRKPNIGLISRAATELNIDLSRSWMVGDATTDIQAGVNAGIKTVLVKTGYAGQDGKCSCSPDLETENLTDAVEVILSSDDSV